MIKLREEEQRGKRPDLFESSQHQDTNKDRATHILTVKGTATENFSIKSSTITGVTMIHKASKLS